jgi:hypothetical protein
MSCRCRFPVASFSTIGGTFAAAAGQSKVFSYSKTGRNGFVCAIYANLPDGASQTGSAPFPKLYRKITTPYGLRTGIGVVQT